MHGILLLLCGLAIGAAHAQYPTKAVRMVVPFPPGGAIGFDAVAKSAPDGYTLLIATTSTHAVGPVLQKLPYDAVSDFTAITLLAHSANVLVVSPQLGVASVRDMARWAQVVKAANLKVQ